jgi:hypothetical protein
MGGWIDEYKGNSSFMDLKEQWKIQEKQRSVHVKL